MYRYFVICGDQRVHSTDSPRDAHSWARHFARQQGKPAFVVRTVCKWEMQAVRTNAT